MMRAARVDANQPEIVKAFRDLGWSVLIISQLKNCCDIVVGKHGENVLVEIKDGKKPPSQQKLTTGEDKFLSNWKGSWVVINSIEGVIKLDKAVRKENNISNTRQNDINPTPRGLSIR